MLGLAHHKRALGVHGGRVVALHLLLVTVSPLARAEAVTPNERVHTGLRVRTAASTEAEILGFLLPGERVPHVRTEGAWREIVFEGEPGFVASSYSRVLAEEAGPAVLRLGAWNIKKLGHGDQKDYPAVARIIDQHFDLLAIVEVMQKGGAHAGYDTLLATLGTNWSGQITERPRPNTSSANAEFYAVVYRRELARPCAGWAGLRFHPDADGASNGAEDVFAREPAFGCFEFGPESNPVGDFLLAAFHATFKSGSAINAEVARLGDVFQTLQAARPGERDLFIAGDFNRTPPQIANLLPTLADRTEGVGSTLNDTGALTANLYDHLLVFDEAASTELVGNAQVLDVRAMVNSHAVFFRTVSDHLPIVVRLESSADDD